MSALRPWARRQRRHFDGNAAAYDRLYGLPSPFQLATVRWMLDLAEVRPGEEVLDLGCGPGRVVVPLLERGCRVHGLDFAEVLLAALDRRANELGFGDRLTLVNAAAEEMEYNARFDLVTARGLLHHLDDPVSVLRKVHTALRPGGRAVFLDPNPLQPAWFPLVVFHPSLSLAIERRLWRQTPRRLEGWLRSAGFASFQVQFMGWIPPAAWRWLSLDDLDRRISRLRAIGWLSLYVGALAHKASAKGK